VIFEKNKTEHGLVDNSRIVGFGCRTQHQPALQEKRDDSIY
jgi:hypothetical protein